MRCNNFFCVISIYFICICLLWACSDKPDTEKLIVGSWINKTRNEHTIFSFQGNGNFKIETRIEGTLSRIIEKRGQASGTFEVKGNVVTLNPKEVQEKSALFEKDKPVTLELAEITSDSLKVKMPSGKTMTYQRMVFQGGEEEKKTAEISLGPMAVNLRKEKNLGRDRFLCFEIDLVLDENANKNTFEAIHPKIKEAIIFHMSSKYYTDINTFDKVKPLKDELFQVIKPYAQSAILKLNLRNIFITTDEKKVTAFLQEDTQDKNGDKKDSKKNKSKAEGTT